MQDILNVYVRITMQDLKAFSFAKKRSGIYKIGFIISIIFTMLLLLGIVAIVLTFSNAKELQMTIILMVIPALLIWGFNLLPAFLTYLKLRSDFEKSKLLGILQCYRFFEDRLEICSEIGSFCLPWNDIFRVYEIKPCFVIQPAPGKIFLIPRRCFNSQEQLDLFINTVESRVDKKRIKLKRYRLRNSKPDYGEIKYQENISQTADIKNENGNPIIEVQVSLSKNEYLAMNFRLYYTKPAGLIITAFGVLLIFSSIRSFFLITANSLIPFVLGVTFTLVMPLMLYSNVVKRYQKDVVLKKPYTYKFYEDYFVVEHPSGTNRIRFCDLVKVTEIKTTILLYVTTQLAHIVPKRIFDGREEELKALRDLLKRNVTKK